MHGNKLRYKLNLVACFRLKSFLKNSDSALPEAVCICTCEVKTGIGSGNDQCEALGSQLP